MLSKYTFGSYKNVDSIILNESNRKEEFIKLLLEWTDCKNMELLYRGTRDGMSADAFHNRCNNKGPTISLFKNENGYLEDMLLLIGQVVVVINQLLIVLYLH